MPFDSQAAKELIKIFETIHHAALEASNELAAKDGTYETWMRDLWVSRRLICGVEGENRQDWIEELAFGYPHAHCVDEPDIGQQRMLRALHQVFNSLLIRCLTTPELM